MKVVINACFGGFSLSAKAIKRYAELGGRECYFFTTQRSPTYDLNKYIPVTIEEADQDITFSAFDIPNPMEVCAYPDNWGSLPDTEKQFYNDRYSKHSLPSGRELDRNDPKLIQVVEELGSGHRTGASGKCAKLSIVEIPDGTDYVIEEYDGNEHIAESHRTWR